MKDKLGFFGGCFNPITNAHIELIKDVIDKEKLKKVYFVPMGDLYSKRDLIPLKHRLKMLELVFEKQKDMEILNISNNEKKMYAIDTFRSIEERFSDSERFFIMGSDNYEKMKNWKDSKELLKNYKYIILDRENGKTKDISSSIVRQKIKVGEDVNDLVPIKILEYIKENNLYMK